jgi:L-asparaginase II
MSETNPILVEVIRGDAVECRHNGAAAVADADGTLVAAWGNVEQPVYARSAIKPMQALPLLESGAAERFAVSDAEIALACASHSGEGVHVAGVGAWLERLGINPGALECGAHPPLEANTADAMTRAGETPTAVHNNCSGKHTGFLATALHLGESLDGYVLPDHPVQQRIAAVLSDLGDQDLSTAPRGVDGCGIPVIGMTLAAIARAAARMARPETLGRGRSDAARRVFAAMTQNPYLVAGRGRFDTVAMQAAAGAFAVKTGAEGVHIAILPEPGLGVALKIDDGAKRGSDTAMAALLDHVGGLACSAKTALWPFLQRSVQNRAGVQVGIVRPAPGWPD